VHLSGLDLRTGGEGHKYFYDKVIPKRLQALIKDHDPDAKLTHHPALVDSGNFERLRHMEESHRRAIENGPHPAMADSMHAGLRELQRIMADNTLSLPGVEITPKMRESILKNGFKAYKRGGRVARADGGSNYQPSLTAAIRIGKNTHTGRYHRDIYAKMTPEERAQAGTDGRQFGFVDETGRYLHRATAMQYAKDMGLLDPRHADTTSPHLIAEHLADRPARADGGGVDKPTVIKLGQRKQNPGVAGFMKDYLASTTEHPFDRRSSVHGDYATTEVSPKGHEIHLHDIRSLNPQKGGGTRALKELLTLSDKHGVPISGTAKAYHNDPRYIESSEGLRDWYKKHGFEDFGGDKWDGYDVRYNPRPGRADGGSLHWEDEPPSAEAIANDARRRQFANPHYTPEFQPTLPHDPTSREKRATELGYTHHGFHGTRADFPAFHPSKVDVGTHIGTDEQANERLRQTQQWSDNPLDHDNIIPVRAKLGKSFHMPDVGGWDDSVEVMNNMVAHGARMNPGWKWPLHMTEVLGRTIDKRNQHQDHWQRGQPDWEKSPENKHALSLINTHLRQNGYGSIKYKNMSENVNGGKSGLRHDVQKHYDELQKQIDQHYAQHHTPGRPSQCNSGNCNVGHLEEKRRALVQNRDNYNDTHSYIVLDPAHLRSRFAQFDPARAHEPDLLAAKGGFMRKPRADGGSVNEDDKLHTGPIHSPVAGRTDHLPMHVPSGSYVIPADIIGAMGEGNTMAGFKHVRRMFGGIPYGNQAAPYGQDKGPYGAKTDTQPYDPSQGPYQSELPGKAHGGSAANHVAIVAAGGEYVLTPDEVRMAGDGDLERGHRVLDEFIKRYRQKTIKTLQKLPGPARD
jgi:hypothetical protein